MNDDAVSTKRLIAGDIHIELHGEITFSDLEGLRERLQQAFELQQAILINCGQASHFGTGVLEFLANLRVEARALGVSLQIQGLPGSVLADASPRGSTLEDFEQRMVG